MMLKRIWFYLFGNPNQSIVKELNKDDVKYLITGLGNIGADYENTRHNIGFKVADALVESLGGSYQTERYGAVAICKSKGRIYIVLKPSTYMNLSGQAIRYWMNKEKIEIQNTMVILDDLNLDFGTIRIKGKGGAGGHNGLKSIEQELQTADYARMRVGIGNNFSKGHQVDFVLGAWGNYENDQLPKILKHCVGACKTFGFLGLEKTMSEFNKKILNSDPPQNTSENEA
jgi:PTH1 family peptidyl-tRNA hydrolase